MNATRVHPRYSYPICGARDWSTALKMALVAGNREQLKPIVFRSRVNGWWYYTFKQWQDTHFTGRR